MTSSDGGESLPEGRCVLNAVNRALQLSGVSSRLSWRDLCETQAALIQANPDAKEGAYGNRRRDFTLHVAFGALRQLLPEHEITITNLCKGNVAVSDILKDIAVDFTKRKESRKTRLFLVDGTLNCKWWKESLSKPQEDSFSQPQEWRHMILLDEQTNHMHENQGGEDITYRAVDTTRAGSLNPTLCTRSGQVSHYSAELGAPYIRDVKRIYEFEVKKPSPVASPVCGLKRKR